MLQCGAVRCSVPHVVLLYIRNVVCTYVWLVEEEMKKNKPEMNKVPATSESRMNTMFDIKFFSKNVINHDARATLLCKIW